MALATAASLLLGGCTVATADHASRPAAARPTSGSPTAAARRTPAAQEAPSRSASRSPAAAPTNGRGTALAQLATLTVRGRAPLTGYDRDRFGQAWLDADRNGCDTRNDILARDVVDKTFEPGTRECVVLTGQLTNPYTGTVVAFARGDDDQVDIDHVVSLGNAWASGAGRWDVHERAALANDPLDLLAVDAHDNRQKGDGDAATWLPPARGYRCAYVSRQVAVKAKYALSVTPAEEAAIARVLAMCPDRPATADPTRAPTRVDQDIQDPGPPRSASVAAATSAGRSRPRSLSARSSVTYANCDAVRAAGRAPIRRGEPGYSSSLDRDGDGIGCE